MRNLASLSEKKNTLYHSFFSVFRTIMKVLNQNSQSAYKIRDIQIFALS